MDIENPTPKKLIISAQKIGKLKPKDRIEIRHAMPTGRQAISTDRQAQFFEKQNKKDPMEQALESGHLYIKSTIEKAEGKTSNIFLVDVRTGPKKVEAIFKPCGDDHGLNCKCGREKAASIVDKVLNFNLVPTTIIKEINDPEYGVEDVGSVQVFDYGEVADNAHLDDDEEGIMALRIFDYIIWNYDRHDWNYLVRSDGETIAIDNELAFGANDNDWARQEIISDIENIAGKELPQEIIEIFERVRNDPTIKLKLRKSLREYLDGKTVNAVLSRIDKITPIILDHRQIPSDEKTLEKLTYS